MLVLSRKANQTIVIDGNIEVQVLKIKGNSVRLGVTAPSTVKVLRGELPPLEIPIPVNQIPVIQNPGNQIIAEAPLGYVKENLENLEHLPNPFAVSHAS